MSIFTTTTNPTEGIDIACGSYVVTTDDASAGLADIPTGFSTAVGGTITGSAVIGFLVDILRAGVSVKADAVISLPAVDGGGVSLGETVLRVADGAATFSIAENDVIHFAIFGRRA